MGVGDIRRGYYFQVGIFWHVDQSGILTSFVGAFPKEISNMPGTAWISGQYQNRQRCWEKVSIFRVDNNNHFAWLLELNGAVNVQILLLAVRGAKGGGGSCCWNAVHLCNLYRQDTKAVVLDQARICDDSWAPTVSTKVLARQLSLMQE